MRIEERCWTNLGLEGQWIHALASTEWGLFAGTREQGVFRLDPRSGQWESLGLDHAIVSAILLVPTPTKRLLVGVSPFSDEQTEAAVFASTDQGRTWNAWDDGLAARFDHRAWAFALAADPADPNLLFMGQSFPIMRSTTGGQNWEYVWLDHDSFGNGIHSIVIAPQRDGRVWAGGRSALSTSTILRSDDRGTNWQHFNPLPGDENEVGALLLDPRSRDGIWAAMSAGRGGVMYSADAGTTWDWVLRIWGKGIVADLALMNGALYAASIDNLRPIANGMELESDLGLYRSRDWGVTWDTLPVPAEVSGGFKIALDGSGGLFIGTREDGVWHVVP